MEQNDTMKKYLTENGKISITVAETTNLVEEARKIHDLTPTTTAALGRLLTATSLMGIELKNVKDSISVQIKGDGEIGTMIAVSDKFPRVRAYIQNPHVELPLNEKGKLDVGGAVGKNGYLNIIKDIGMKEPYIGIVPDATEEDITKLEENIKNISSISKMLSENKTLDDIAKIVTGDKNIKVIEENIYPVYECNCSYEKFEKGLISLGKKELEDLIKTDEKVETVCHFCNKKYIFDKQKIKQIIDNI